MDIHSELKGAQLEVRDTDYAHSANEKGRIWFSRALDKVKVAFNSTLENLATESWVVNRINSDTSVAITQSENSAPIFSKASSVERKDGRASNGPQLSPTQVGGAMNYNYQDIPELSLSVYHEGGPFQVKFELASTDFTQQPDGVFKPFCSIFNGVDDSLTCYLRLKLNGTPITGAYYFLNQKEGFGDHLNIYDNLNYFDILPAGTCDLQLEYYMHANRGDKIGILCNARMKALYNNKSA